MGGPFGLQILQFRRHTLVNGFAQRTHGAARLPLLRRAATRPQPRTRHVDLPKYGSQHDRPGVLVRQHRATTVANQLAFHPPGSLLRHQQRLNLSEQGATFGKCKSQVGDAPVLSFDHSNRRRFSLTRFPRLQAGLDDQSHSNSNRVGNVGSIADTASVPGGLAGLFSLETSQTPSGVSHRVRRRHAVYGGGRVDGNSLPRFGSLSFTQVGRIDRLIADAAYYQIERDEQLLVSGVVPVIPPKADAVDDVKQNRWHDQLLRHLKEKGQYAFQNKYGYSRRARVEAQFSRIKRCIGDTLLTRRIASQTQEGRAIANLINQWNAFGQARCVKKP